MEPDVKPENSKVQKMSVNDKELSFRLDEPVTTALNVNSLTNAVEDESLSFIVLGKDSVEAQTSLLASYIDIQQKCMSIDYKSIVSSLNMTEMQNRLAEVLQENVKLKETLKSNNESMKQQFNTLATWQEEVTKVHQNHKQKFAETKELINHLKKENAELKTKLWLLHHTEGFEAISAISESTIDASTTKAELEQNIVKELESAMKSLTINCNDIHSYEDCVKTINSLRCSEACSAKDQQIASLQESIALLEQKLQCVFNPIKSQDLSDKTSSNLNRQKLIQNMKQYNDTLQELTECFVAQVERFAAIEKGLKEITDILKLDDDNFKMQYKEKLCQYCKQLADEQVKIITDRQILIKSQDRFQKIFSDYNSILYEMEIIVDENTKLNLQTSEQLEQVKGDKQSLEEEKRILNQEKDNVQKEKEFLESQKNSLNMERISLHDEKKLVAQEKISLNEEKMSLDHQSKLYENCERDLHNEKKALQVRYEQLLGETNNLRHVIKGKNVEFQKIKEQLAQSAEEINLLRSQLTLYEEDFMQEKKLKEALIEEKNNLSTELEKQIRFNKQLQDNSSANTEASSRHSDFITGLSTKFHLTEVCPKCSSAYLTLPDLMKHIENCID
ncbi:myosin-2 heavy chain isoform X1 [Solenopsis invicta]|uniref:myosin-2 heavy chain isoform X1 n=1 Tax=Solenopsis invicta TaxID=13686 RepID=UPI00193EA743|nr:myosin-2 heavy chain isoform X1 [Solenopsis invicta]